jgi:hypothetical protein
MDKLEQYRDIIETALRRIVDVTENAFTKVASLRDKTVLDRQTDSYLIVREGWDGPRHIDRIVVHLEILNGKVWIQEDWIEHGIATELEAAGIPKSDIVLGFQPPDIRALTEYAAA